MELSVVLLDAGASHRLQVLVRPVQLKWAADGIHQALVALEDLQWARNPALGKKGGMSRAKSRIGGSKPFPVGECSCSGDAQSVIGRPADCHSVGCSVLVQSQC